MDNHIILLRVNQYWESLKGTPGQLTREKMYKGNPNWLDIRLNWFNNLLLENLKHQQDKDFWCFMLVDPLTPPKYKNKLYEYEQLGFIKIIENNGDKGMGMDEDILTTYKSVRKNTSNEIICSRIDTDDMVGPHWNTVVKQALKNKDRISLENVLLFNFITKETKILNWKKGSFVSTKSTLDNFDNPRAFSHNTAVNTTPVITDYPLVCMGIHDNNTTNHNWWPAGNPYPLEDDIFNQMFKISK